MRFLHKMADNVRKSAALGMFQGWLRYRYVRLRGRRDQLRTTANSPESVISMAMTGACCRRPHQATATAASPTALTIAATRRADETYAGREGVDATSARPASAAVTPRVTALALSDPGNPRTTRIATSSGMIRNAIDARSGIDCQANVESIAITASAAAATRGAADTGVSCQGAVLGDEDMTVIKAGGIKSESNGHDRRDQRDHATF